MSKSTREPGPPKTYRRKATSSKVSKVAALGTKYPERLTLEQIQMVCASALAQDETSRKLDAVKAALEATG